MDQIPAYQKVVSKEERLFSFLIVIMVLFHVYKPSSISISFGEILIFLCIPLYFRREMKFPLERQEIGFVLFFCYMMISSMILGIVFDAPISKYFSIARAGFYWILIFYFGKNLFNKEVFEKWMIVFSTILSVFILVQYIVSLLTGYYIPGLIMGLSVNNGAESGAAIYEHSLYLADLRGFLRPHGFLAEPAHSSEFLFISIVTLICDRAVFFKKKIMLVLLFSLAIVATQSTTGIVLLGFALFLLFSMEKKLSIFRFPLVLIFVVLSAYAIFGGENSNSFALGRIIDVANGSEIDASSNIRLNNGLNLFLDLPFVFKIFGTGAGLSEYVFNSLGIENANKFMSAFSGILFNTGAIGFIIWITSLVIFFVMSGLLGRSLVIGFFIMTFGSSIYCQPQMVWFFLLIMADIRKNDDRYLSTEL